MDTYGLIDAKNKDLWTELKSIQEIEIQFFDKPYYSSFSQSNKTIIYVSKDNINSSSFTHELLHVYIRTKKIFIGSALILFIKERQCLLRIFSDGLLEHIGNCLDHIKMLPEFLRLGYESKQFLFDYATNKLTKVELDQIKRNYIFGRIYKAEAIDLYIGKYFAAKACPSMNYTRELSELKSIDSSLYKILNKFLDSWDNFDINNNDPIVGGYHSFLSDFVDELENWTIGKKII